MRIDESDTFRNKADRLLFFRTLNEVCETDKLEGARMVANEQ